MQLRGPEKPQNVLPVATEVYKEIKTIQEYPDNIVKEQLDGKRFSIYEVSDGKCYTCYCSIHFIADYISLISYVRV